MNVFPFIAAEQAVRRNVKRACELLEVSRSAYYQQQSGVLSRRDRLDAELTDTITRLHAVSKGTYGAPRIHADLTEAGRRHGRKRVARLMRAAGLAGKSPRRWRVTTTPDPDAAKRPDLIGRDFTTDPAATGFEFSLRLLLRRSKPFGRRVEPVDYNPRRWRARPELAPPDFPRLSVQFADGTVISNLDRILDDELEPARPQLVDGPQELIGRQRTDLPYWVWRLPPPGLITFICHWPACEITDARAQIDASRILDAAARSIDPWPRSP